MKTVLAVLGLTAVAVMGGSAGATLAWQRTFGGTGRDEAHDVRQTSDGGYILAGYTESYGVGGYDMYLVKTDVWGNLQWSKTFGGTSDDRAYSVQQTSDGGFILAGVTRSYAAGYYDMYLVKTDGQGNLQWQRTFGGTSYDYAYSVQQTSDGGFILAGVTGGDMYLVKTDAQGNRQWQKTFGGAEYALAYSVRQTTDGGFILAGETWSYGAGSNDMYLVKTDAKGNLQWWKTFGGAGYDVAHSVQQTSDGGFILAGETSSYGVVYYDMYMVKTDVWGNLQWWKTFGGAGYDRAYSVRQTTDGGFILAGVTSSYGAGGDTYLVKTDALGNFQGSKTFGGAGYDWIYSVQQTTDGGFILVGETSSYGAGSSDMYLVKVGVPNLTITNYDFGPQSPIQVQPGDLLALGAFVENTGQASTGGPFWLEFWGSRTGGLTLDNMLADSALIPSMPESSYYSYTGSKPLYSIPDGPYTVVFAADRPNQVQEGNERDNRPAVAGKRLLVIRPQTNADLAVEGFSISPNPAYSGQWIWLAGRVSNVGSENSGPFWIEFWGSFDRLYPQLNFLLCDSIIVGDLAPGAFVNLAEYPRRLYDCPLGVFKVGVFADRLDQVNETDETNNYAFVDGVTINRTLSPEDVEWPVSEAAGPDLVVVSVNFSPFSPTQATPGSAIMLWARVENQGSAPSGPFWIEFWGSRLGGLTLDQLVADSGVVSAIPAGGAVDLSLTRSLYSIPDGPYTITVVADRPGQVAESNEGNNRRAVAGKRLLSIRPQTQANLVVESFSLGPNPMRAGQPLTLGGRVRNSGSESSGPFWIELWGSFDEDYPVLGFFLCDSIPVANLAPSASVDLSTYSRTVYPGVPVGNCAVFCFADRIDQVNETNEADNYSILRGYQIAP